MDMISQDVAIRKKIFDQLPDYEKGSISLFKALNYVEKYEEILDDLDSVLDWDAEYKIIRTGENSHTGEDLYLVGGEVDIKYQWDHKPQPIRIDMELNPSHKALLDEQ